MLVRPTLDGGRLYVTNVDGLAMALDAATGSLLWRYQRPPDVTRVAELTLYAAPPAVVSGEQVFLGFADGAVVALDAARGDVLWEKTVGEGTYPDVVAAPVALGADLFASGYFAPFVAIDQATRNVRWRLEYGSAQEPLVAYRGAEAILYHPGTNGVLHAVVARTGEELWAWDSGTVGALTTPVLTDAGLFLGSSDGQVYLVDPETGRQTWHYHERIRLQGVSSAPIVDGRQVLFVTNAGYLHSMISPAPTRFGGDRAYPSRHRHP
jgi:outer membrane protein assembly factor BamB